MPEVARLLTVREVADATGLPARTLQELCRSGRLKAKKVGRRYWIRLSDFERWWNGDQ